MTVDKINFTCANHERTKQEVTNTQYASFARRKGICLDSALKTQTDSIPMVVAVDFVIASNTLPRTVAL